MGTFLDGDFLLVGLQLLTIVVTLGLGWANLRGTRRIEQGRNIVGITTTYRLDRMKRMQEALQQLRVSASPVNLRFNAEAASGFVGKALEAAATFDAVLHPCYDCDRELIGRTQACALAAARYTEALRDGADAAEEERTLERLLDEVSVLCNKYTYAEWIRIKRETEGRNTRTEEWFEAYAEVSKNFDRKPSVDPVEKTASCGKRQAS